MPLDPTFWNAEADEIEPEEPPLREHPETLKWAFRDFLEGGVHVIVEAELVKRNPQSVCCKAHGRNVHTAKTSGCTDCQAFLKKIRRLQDRCSQENTPSNKSP